MGRYDPVVRRLFRWLVGVLGALAVWRVWTRRRDRHPEPERPEPDPAEELRRRLAETRVQEDDEGTRPDEAPPATETLDERRARVHAKAQEAIDAMHDHDA